MSSRRERSGEFRLGDIFDSDEATASHAGQCLGDGTGPLANTPLWCYVMEKKKPTYDLGSIQASAGATMGITNAAIQGAAEMGMTRADMIGVIKGLKRRDFYKSMTTHHNHRVWMDVYHGRADGYEIYIKFVQDTVAEFTCTSFKEK
jgi:motility quorum-sensing regulator/GCU-specific mRNA interferase toxin